MFSPSWQTRHIATRVSQFQVLGSTQEEARRLIGQGDALGALVIAGEQTGGRGRFTHRWYSPPGNLYLSFVIRPDMLPEQWAQCAMLTGLALRESIAVECSLPAQLKWPNDVLIRGRKAAGILGEVVGAHLVVGVGVNVNAELPQSLGEATSLRVETGAPVAPYALLRRFVELMDANYMQLLAGTRFTRAWAAQLSTLGQFVKVRMGEQLIEGVAEDVDDAGALILRRRDGVYVSCLAGEVSLHAD